MTRKRKILVVEDDEGLNELICRKLGKEGHDTSGVLSGEAAISFLEKEMPDLMLLDYQMPGLGGAEVIEHLRERSLEVPFMIVTGNGDERVAVEMMKQGALDYLVKDAEFNHILPEKVKQVLKTLAVQEELEESRSRLKIEEERYRLLAENSVDVIWQMSMNMKLTYASKACESNLGYTPAEIRGRKLQEFTEPKFFIQIVRNTLTMLNNPEEHSYIQFETKLLHKNGSKVPMEITGKLYQDKNGKAIGFQGSAREISERIRSRQQVSYQKNLLKTLIDNVPDTIYVKDEESRYILNNQGHMHDLGVGSQDELIGKRDHDYFDKDIADEFLADEKRILESGQPIINKEVYISDAEGNPKWALTTKVPIRNENDKIIGIAGVNRDITRRKEQEDELIKSRYELALKNKIANIFLLDDNGSESVAKKLLDAILDEMKCSEGFLGYITVNRNLQLAALSEHLLHAGQKEIQPGLELSEAAWEGAWAEAINTQKTVVSNNSVQLLQSQMEVKNVLAVPIVVGNRSVGVITVANKLGGFSGIEIDLLNNLINNFALVIEARVQAEEMRKEKDKAYADLVVAKEKAEESNNLKSSFLLNLSHEVRTPLNSIIGFANLLSGKYKDDPKTKQFSDMIDIAGRDLIKMIEDTIDISKLENNDVAFTMTDVDLVPVMDDLYRDFRGQFEKRYPQLHLDYVASEERIPAHVDPVKLKKAISKVLDNAGKFTETGSIQMHLRKYSDSAQITIEDTGIGIPEELTEAVFEKFRKIVNKDLLYKGSGLGLTIARELLVSMSCSISLSSMLGQGTKVLVNIPSSS